jgi:hypothetical protein
MSKPLLMKAVAHLVDDKGSDAKKIIAQVTASKMKELLDTNVKKFEKTIVNKIK